jgi:predicted nucleotidyltransferase
MPIFRSRHQADLLTWLLLHPDQEFSVTDLASRVGVPVTTLHREMQRLVEAGLLRDRTIGRSRMVRANPDNPATAPLTELLGVSFGPRAVIGEEFDVRGVEQVLIFGSWAERYRGTPGEPPGDVDVLVIGAPKRAEVYDAADRAQARLGRQVNPVVRSAAQWASAGDSLVEQVRSSPTVTVIPADSASA